MQIASSSSVRMKEDTKDQAKDDNKADIGLGGNYTNEEYQHQEHSNIHSNSSSSSSNNNNNNNNENNNNGSGHQDFVYSESGAVRTGGIVGLGVGGPGSNSHTGAVTVTEGGSFSSDNKQVPNQDQNLSQLSHSQQQQHHQQQQQQQQGTWTGAVESSSSAAQAKHAQSPAFPVIGNTVGNGTNGELDSKGGGNDSKQEDAVKVVDMKAAGAK